MSNQNLVIRDGASIKTTAASPAPALLGDLNVNLATNNLEYHNGTSAVDIDTASNTLTLTNKSMDATANVFTNIANSAISSSAAIAYSKLATLTNNKAVVSNASGVITTSTTTDTEIGFVSGVTSSIQTQLNSKLNLTGGTMSGAINMGSNKVTSVTDPTSAQDAATKNYVDNVAAGINPAIAVQAATTSSSDLTGYTYNNGVSGIGATLTAGSSNVALTVDGFTFTTLGQRLLVKDNITPANNGIYYVTQVQGSILPVILTRALDYDTPSDMNNTGAIPVINGTVNGTTQWVLTSLVTTVGTDALTFTKFARNPADYLLKANNLSDVAVKATAFNNISPNTTKGDFTVNTGSTNVRQAIGTDNQVLIADSTQTNGLKWTTLQQGAKNYITFNNFENNTTTGWSLGTIGTLTNGLPTGSPTFGSGASGNLSISVVNSGQLAGSASLSYASTTATTAGDMLASQAYAIDLEDQAKVLGYRFYFKAQSGAANCNFSGTSSNSFALAAYDVTNSVFLPVVGAFSMVQGTGVGIASGTLQTGATTASIRWIVYNANATAGAATLYLDDFFSGPQVSPIAPAMSDLVAYTPIYGGFGTVTGSNVSWKRVGDSVEISGTFITGAVAASLAKISLPSGLSIDTTKLSGASQQQIVGIGGQSSTNAGSTFSIIASPSNTTTDLYFTALAFTGINPLVAENGNSVSASSTLITLQAKIPIAGWSSNSVASSDTDTRVITSSYYVSAGTFTSTTSIPINFDTQIYDSAASVITSATAWKFVAPVSGWYDISGFLLGSGATSPYITVYKNGSAFQTLAQTPAINNNSVTLVGQLKLNSGDFIDFRCSTSSNIAGGSLAANGTSWIRISRVSGPAVVTATETVAASYSATTGQSTGGARTVINFNSKEFDTHNAVTTGGGWIFTTPVSGIYNVASQVAWQFGASTTGDIYIFVNGSQYSTSEIFSTSGNDACVTINTLLKLNAGDTVQIQAIYNGGTLAIIAALRFTNFNIHRVGN